MDYKKHFSDKLLSILDKETVLIILERTDKSRENICNQFNKTTDRLFTLIGLSATAFATFTVFLINAKKFIFIFPFIEMWIGSFIIVVYLFYKIAFDNSSYIVETQLLKTVDEHNYINKLKYLSEDEINNKYQIKLIVNSIESNLEKIEVYSKLYDKRIKYIKITLLLILYTITISLGSYLLILMHSIHLLF